MRVHRWVVGTGDAGERLDRAIAQRVPDLSRRRARFLLDAGSIWIDGKRVRVASRFVQAGEEIVCHVQSLALGPRESLDPSLVLHEDAWILAIDKPAGVPSHPTRARQQGTATQLAEEWLRRREGEKVPLWPLHRLDAGTSGILLFAKTREAARHVNRSFAGRAVAKSYAAVVHGIPDWDETSIAIPLEERHLESRAAPDGKPAETAVRVLRRGRSRTLLEIRPRTGRMHQIRVHLASIGLPIVGDPRYGRDPRPEGRLLLHASALRLPHPEGGRDLDLGSPLPPELAPD